MAQTPSNLLLVLDAWPVMEWFKGRAPVASQVEALLLQAQRGEVSLCISRMNLGEIYYNLAKHFGDSAGLAMFAQFQRLPVEVITVTDADIDQAARLKAKYPISYADAFAAMLSVNKGAALVTGDHEFLQLRSDSIIELHWLNR